MTKKKTHKGSSKKTAETPVNTGKKSSDIRNSTAEVRSESEHGQAWESGLSVETAEDESENE